MNRLLVVFCKKLSWSDVVVRRPTHSSSKVARRSDFLLTRGLVVSGLKKLVRFCDLGADVVSPTDLPPHLFVPLLEIDSWIAEHRPIRQGQLLSFLDDKFSDQRQHIVIQERTDVSWSGRQGEVFVSKDTINFALA